MCDVRYDYYPFGVTFNSYRRENSLLNKIKFQGQERITDLDLGWDSFKYRNYMSDIGRFFNVDPLADKYVYNSPYAFAENKLGMGVELEGRELLSFLEGAANAMWSNHHPTQAGRGMGLSTTKDQGAYMRGQQAGDVASLIIGTVEAVGGALSAAAGVVGEIPTAGLSTVVVVAGAAMATEGVVVVNNAGSNLLNTDGQVYKVPGNKTQSGKPYVGRTKQGSPEKRGQGANDGRDRTDAEVIDTYDSNNPGEGQYKEQKAIDNNGGVENLDNKRNEVKPEKMKELEKKYGQSNTGSNGGTN